MRSTVRLYYDFFQRRVDKKDQRYPKDKNFPFYYFLKTFLSAINLYRNEKIPQWAKNEINIAKNNLYTSDCAKKILHSTAQVPSELLYSKNTLILAFEANSPLWIPYK